MIGLFVGATGQNFQSRVNLSLFAGGSAQITNVNNWGRYAGLYADGAFYVSYDEMWRLGLFATANWSKYEGYTDYYANNRFEYACGLYVGCYQENLSPKFSFFAGQNLGIKYGEQHDGQLLSAGTYDGKQKDYFLVGSTNLNLLKAYNNHLFPRMQLLFSWQAMFASAKQSYWNEQPIPNVIAWDNSYLELIYKQTIFSLGNKVRIDLKAVVGYNHYVKGDPDSYVIGGELSIHQNGRDDALSLFVQQKMPSHFDQNFICVGANWNFMQMFNR